MATDKDKGLVGGAADILGGATDSLRETTRGLGGGGPWHSPNSEVYHNNPSCQTGTASHPRTFSRAPATSPFV